MGSDDCLRRDFMVLGKLRTLQLNKMAATINKEKHLSGKRIMNKRTLYSRLNPRPKQKYFVEQSWIKVKTNMDKTAERLQETEMSTT